MDGGKALEVLRMQSLRKPQAVLAQEIGRSEATISRWLSAKSPPKRGLGDLILWAELQPSPDNPGAFKYGSEAGAGRINGVIREAQDQTAANLVRLSEISGYAKAVLTMMQAVTDAQARVVESLAPYVEAEEQLDVEPLDPEVAAQITADMISSAMARAAAQAQPPKPGARRAR